jgi:predicted transposase/invertase (TIGR01784 family)
VKKKSSDTPSVHQPHDKVSKRFLFSPATARDILSLYLPADVLAIADLNNLELQRDTFIDDEHRTNAVDLLYKTTFQGEEGYIWVLLENQRKSDPWMPVRLFKYIGIIWDHIRKESNSQSKSISIPLIYPLVIYNGDTPYTHSRNLRDLIEPEASKKIFDHIFTNPFLLVDLTTIPDEALKRSAQGRIKGIVLLMALKHVTDKRLQSFLEDTLMNFLKQLDQAGDTDELADVVYYLLNENEYIDEDWFWTNFHQNFSEEAESKMTTITQKIRERGIEEGKEQIAKQLLSEKTGLSNAELIEWVHRITGLSIEKVKELQKKH